MAKVKHIALLKFKEGTPEEQIEKVFDEMLDATESIPGIEDYVSGDTTSPEGLSQGFTHAYIITFQDAVARDSFLAHPERERVKNEMFPLAESVLLLDFEI